MSDLPERLVVVASFVRPEVARRAVTVLQAEGIYSETGTGYYKGRSDEDVRVFEADLHAARAALAPLVQEELRRDAVVCPRCSGQRVSPRPAAGLYALVAGLMIAITLAFLRQPPWTSLVAFIAGALGAPVLEKLVGRWRCDACGNIWVRTAPPR